MIRATKALSLELTLGLRNTGINYIYHQRKNLKKLFILNDKEKLLLKQRSLVETTFNTILSRRRLNVRSEQKVKHFESFIYLAMIDLIFTKLGPL